MRPKAVVVSLDRDTEEIEALVSSLGFVVADVVVQRRESPDPATFIGSGKVEEVRERMGELEARLAVFNATLRAGQIANLERDLACDVYDRVRLILTIFETRARTREAVLQVELARLRFEMPLVREYIHLAKKGEHPGFMAGGEYGVDQYYEQIRRRGAKIERELERIEAERAQRRKHRRRGGFYLVALAGYTNAGKSSLLQALTGRTVTIEDRLFSTLETRTARLKGPRWDTAERGVLLTDTVGFIRNLPPFLVDAFHATLEETAEADRVLLVVDGSDPLEEIVAKVETSLAILRGFPEAPPMEIVLNKADLVPTDERRRVEHILGQTPSPIGAVRWVSTSNREGLSDLMSHILRVATPTP